MKKQKVHALLIERGSSFSKWSVNHGYKTRTVTQVVQRWAGKKSLPRGRLTYRILQDLSREIGHEIIPGILEAA